MQYIFKLANHKKLLQTHFISSSITMSDEFLIKTDFLILQFFFPDSISAGKFNIIR